VQTYADLHAKTNHIANILYSQGPYANMYMYVHINIYYIYCIHTLHIYMLAYIKYLHIIHTYVHKYIHTYILLNTLYYIMSHHITSIYRRNNVIGIGTNLRVGRKSNRGSIASMCRFVSTLNWPDRV